MTDPQRPRPRSSVLAGRIARLRISPPETMFLHRMLVGCFLLCARLGARVDVASLIRPFVSQPVRAQAT